MLKRLVYILSGTFLALVVVFIVLFFTYFNNVSGVDPATRSYYQELKSKLVENGYDDNLIIVSGIRWKWHNDLLNYFKTGAAKNSFHLDAKALDVIVRDVNKDGRADKQDVIIVKEILEKDIVRNNGGVGIYLNSNHFFSKQMVHFDCRGYKARWNY